MTSIADIPINDIKEFLLKNNVKFNDQNLYSVAIELILNKKL